ncbi:MAG: hypothetical protein NVSMB9_17180 [Isosphaeraceae bacterium]
MSVKTKLKLTWIGKDVRPRLEPCIFLEDPEKSCHAAQKRGENDIFDARNGNILIINICRRWHTSRLSRNYLPEGSLNGGIQKADRRARRRVSGGSSTRVRPGPAAQGLRTARGTPVSFLSPHAALLRHPA